MSSRVLAKSQSVSVRSHHFVTAFGTAVNTDESSRPAADSMEAGPETEPNPELGGALLRIQILDRRIAELEQDGAQQRAAGHAEGFAEGLRTGREQAAAQWAPLLDRMAQSIGEIATYRARFRREAEPELVRLSMGIAKKILRRELSIDPHALLGVLKAALESINHTEVLEVRISVDDSSALSGRISDLGLPAAVNVTGDPALARGDLRIETKRGSVDASIQTQLAEIENGLADRSGSRR
ncbi:MAG: hypothetical protein FJW30_10530 [Acidobacteria bacterium]|nr:hypothetical protein [Acidobacteriota bacterium]